MAFPSTPRHALPLLSAGQAQKELMHNEALLLADFLMNPVVEEVGRNVPPETAEPGEAWILGTAPVGEWTGRAEQIACWTDGGWRYLAPFEGLHIWVRDQALWASHDAAAWSLGIVKATELRVEGVRVLGSRQPAIADPSGGMVVDTEARSTLAAILAMLRAHGIISA